jgi:transcriptional regulator with XRE-family HTH domain
MPRRPTRKLDDWSKWAVAARRATGLNQTLFGEAIGRSKGAITDWERGENKPDTPSIDKILKKVPKVPRPPFKAGEGVSDPDRTVPPSETGAYVTKYRESGQVAAELEDIHDEALRRRARTAAMAAIDEVRNPSELGADKHGQTAPSGR